MGRRFNPIIFVAASLVYLVFNQAAVAEVLEKNCPFSCRSAGYPKNSCKDWRIGNRCYVEKNDSITTSNLILCLNNSDGSITARLKCGSVERRLDYASLVGPAGSAGTQGPSGSSGVDGTLRVYGDGSAGDKVFSASTTFQESNPQFRDVTINPGVTLTVPSGVVIRCSGSFTNNGIIRITPGIRDTSRFAQNGSRLTEPGSSGIEAPGGSGGTGLPSGVIKQLLRPGIVAAGNGYMQEGDTGSDGGGVFVVIAKNSISNSGSITANGIDASLPYRGGGGGGFIVLSSNLSVSNSGSIEAIGGDGGPLLATDTNSTGFGPGGGGGGGIAHLIAPSVTSSGSILVTGGMGGAGGGSGSITGLIYYGGGSGGGSGGNGGDGGTINPGAIGDDSVTAGAQGDLGISLFTEAAPVSFF